VQNLALLLSTFPLEPFDADGDAGMDDRRTGKALCGYTGSSFIPSYILRLFECLLILLPAAPRSNSSNSACRLLHFRGFLAEQELLPPPPYACLVGFDHNLFDRCLGQKYVHLLPDPPNFNSKLLSATTLVVFYSTTSMSVPRMWHPQPSLLRHFLVVSSNVVRRRPPACPEPNPCKP